MIKGMVSVGDIVQTYAYGKPYRVGEVLSLSMGRAEIKLPREIVWVETDFLAVIVPAN